MPAIPDMQVTLRFSAAVLLRRPRITIGNMVRVYADFTDGDGAPTAPGDPVVILQPPATVDVPNPAPVVYSLTSAPPLTANGVGSWYADALPAVTGSWGVRGPARHQPRRRLIRASICWRPLRLSPRRFR